MTTTIKRLGIRLPVALDEELTKIADYMGYTKNALVITILRQYIEAEKLEARKQNE